MISSRSREYLNHKVGGTHQLLKDYMVGIEADAKINAPNYWRDRTSSVGARGRINHDVKSNPGSKSFTMYLGHGVLYGKFLEEGTAPHIIRPKNKKALYWSGAAHPVKMVNHPGTKPRPLLEDTLRKNKDKLIRAIGRHWANE